MSITDFKYLKAQIAREYPTSPFPENNQYTDYDDDPRMAGFAQDVRLVFAGRSWMEIAPEVLGINSDEYFMLVPKAAAYFLPALLTAVLSVAESTPYDFDAMLAVQTLPRPRNSTQLTDYQARLQGLLSDNQRALVLLTLLASYARQFVDEVHNEADLRAIMKFWGD